MNATGNSWSCVGQLRSSRRRRRRLKADAEMLITTSRRMHLICLSASPASRTFGPSCLTLFAITSGSFRRLSPVFLCCIGSLLGDSPVSICMGVTRSSVAGRLVGDLLGALFANLDFDEGLLFLVCFDIGEGQLKCLQGWHGYVPLLHFRHLSLRRVVVWTSQ